MIEHQKSRGLNTFIFLVSIGIIIFLVVRNSIFSNIKSEDSVVFVEEQEFPLIEVEIEGNFNSYKDFVYATPLVRYVFYSDSIEMIIGNEPPIVPYVEDSLRDQLNNILRKLTDNLEINYPKAYLFFNPYLPVASKFKIRKMGAGEIDRRCISGYKFANSEAVEYFEMDTIDQVLSHLLSNSLNEIASRQFINEIDTSGLIVASSMSEALKHPEKVYKLNLKRSQMLEIPAEIELLKNLQILNISGSKVRSLPDEIGNCENLKSIIANASQLTALPPSIGNLKKLRTLYVGYCQLKDIPSEIGDLGNLRCLSISNNEIEEIPQELSNLKNLTVFTFDNNKIKEFPSSVLGMKSLRRLWFFENDIKQVPFEFKNLKYLDHVRVDKVNTKNIDSLSRVMPSVIFLHNDN